MSQTENEAPETPTPISELAQIGDVFLVRSTEPIPDGYLELQGQQLMSHLLPEFAKAMGITGPTFTLPTPQRVVEGLRYVIKVGQVLAPPPAPLTDSPLVVDVERAERLARREAERAERRAQQEADRAERVDSRLLRRRALKDGPDG